MQLRNYHAFVIAIVSLPVLVLSCRKNDNPFVNPDEPQVEMPADPPVYLAYKVSDFEHLNLSFKYDEFPNKVSVYYDDTLTEDKYDHIFAEYLFNKAGYLTGNTFYNVSGDVKSSLTIERNTNIITSVLVKHKESGVDKTDTFRISFTDSSGAPDYTFMNVDYGKYFSEIPVTMKFTYYKNEAISSSAGLYTFDDRSVFFPSFIYRYNSLNKLESKLADLYYGIDYTYDQDGKGIDSLFKILGGRDWQYLENVLNYDENTSIFFYPLYVSLSDNNVDIDTYLHRYGAFTEVRSIPNGEDYPYIAIFDFINTFDDKKKLIQSTIYNLSLIHI